LLRDERGAVTAEAVIMMPFFLIVWGCVIYVAQKYERAIETSQVARECAWRHAKDNCETDVRCAISDGLPEAAITAADVEGSPRGGREVAAGESSEGMSIGSSLGGSLVNLILGREITATARKSVPKPRVIGGGNLSITWRVALSCNEKPRGDFGQVISDAFRDLWRAF
jgi:hypothetical protein